MSFVALLTVHTSLSSFFIKKASRTIGSEKGFYTLL